ncbi:sigma-70 family RNA polymerase sigma factor [Fulvivirgaceae bacterium BMA12]|uniref:Sigma-70 family RNA polymerase sigma factor n=1 Tax=Agaribacillus aureus TaxID=3051825 RepID=A0ABT8LA17_9BACT|nr:sigma-70 family RNA polymerase sigma factor [Fulvivirgaceae bacterium BMA12]
MINIQDTWHKIVADNDQRAFELFFDYFYPKLFNFSLQYVKSPSGAEEVVSDVIYNLLKDKDRLGSIERISAYLFQSVKNKSLSWLRDQKKNLKFERIEQAEDYVLEVSNDPEMLPMDRNIYQLLEGAVEKLPDQRKMVYKLIREEGLLLDEVAELLSISARTVEKHLELAVKELCQHLRGYLQDQRQHPKIRKFFPRNFIFIFF